MNFQIELVDFFDIELFSDFYTDLEILVFTEDSKGIAKAIKLLDLELVTDVKSMLVQIVEKVKTIVNPSQEIGA